MQCTAITLRTAVRIRLVLCCIMHPVVTTEKSSEYLQILHVTSNPIQPESVTDARGALTKC